MRLRKWLRRTAIAGGSLAALRRPRLDRFESADRAFPPPLPAKLAVSTEVTDRDGALLRAYATPDGRWRLATTLDQVDPQFVKMLVAYEDKRFFDHAGVDSSRLPAPRPSSPATAASSRAARRCRCSSPA